MTVIFYVVTEPKHITVLNSRDYSRVGVRKPDGSTEYSYVRTEYFCDDNEELAALDSADPRPGETVLNTVYIDD